MAPLETPEPSDPTPNTTPTSNRVRKKAKKGTSELIKLEDYTSLNDSTVTPTEDLFLIPLQTPEDATAEKQRRPKQVRLLFDRLIGC
jgi:hypothetical protein